MMSAWVFTVACGAHPGGAARAGRPPDGSMAPDGTGIAYRLEWGGRVVGRERIAFGRSEGFDQWVGHVTQTEPLETELRWEVWLDPSRGEPAGFEVRLALAGEALRTRGWRDGDRFRFERRGFGDVETGAVGYGAGTVVDLASPLSWWWAAGRLAHRMDPGEGADVRLLAVRPPALAPEIRVVRLARKAGVDGGLEIEGPGDETTTIQLDRDGWPERVETDRPHWGRSLIRRRETVEAVGR